MKKISEQTARNSIAMMQGIANSDVSFPFLKEVAKEMEQMLEELIELRKAQEK